MLRRAASTEDEDGRRRDARSGKREAAGQRNPGHAPAPSALGSRLSRGSRSRLRGAHPRSAHSRTADSRTADSRTAQRRSARRRRRSLRGRRRRGNVAEPKRRREGSLSAFEADLRRTTGQAFLEVGLQGAPVGVIERARSSGREQRRGIRARALLGQRSRDRSAPSGAGRRHQLSLPRDLAGHLQQRVVRAVYLA
jgi:hypothetical protein